MGIARIKQVFKKRQNQVFLLPYTPLYHEDEQDVLQTLHHTIEQTTCQEKAETEQVLIQVTEIGCDKKPSLEKEQAEPCTHSYNMKELLSIIHKALKENKIEMLLQPVVTLPQRKVRFFECSARVYDGEKILLFPQAHGLLYEKGTQFLPIIDNTVLFRCIQLIRKVQKKDMPIGFFCPLSLATLQDTTFLQSFMEFMNDHPALAGSLIFQLSYGELSTVSTDIFITIRHLAYFGSGFCLNDPDNIMSINLKELYHHGFKYIKIPASFVKTALKQVDTENMLKTFIKQCHLLDLKVIITHLDKEKDFLETSDFHFDYGQGFLFGKPTLGH